AYQSVEHLIEQGCQKIAHIGGKSHVHIYHERINGYKQALADHHLPFDEQLVIQGNMKLNAGRKIIGKMLEANTRPDALFSASDYSAMGAMQVLLEYDIQVPEQVAVIGYSNESFSSFVTPSLTSVDQHSVQIGELAAKLFLDQMDEDNTVSIPRKTILSPEL